MVILEGSNKKLWAGIEESQVMQEPRMSTGGAVTTGRSREQEEISRIQRTRFYSTGHLEKSSHLLRDTDIPRRLDREGVR